MKTMSIERAITIIEENQSGARTRMLEYATKIPAYAETQLLDCEAFEIALAALRKEREREENPGDASDGFHTFNELCHHRAVLFSVICNQHPDKAWKSRLHSDGTMFEGDFIVGINAPAGPASYHYNLGQYWDMFKVPEIPNAPEWDGYTSAQAIERIGSIEPVALPVRCKDCEHYKPTEGYPEYFSCKRCYYMPRMEPGDSCSYGIPRSKGKEE